MTFICNYQNQPVMAKQEVKVDQRHDAWTETCSEEEKKVQNYGNTTLTLMFQKNAPKQSEILFTLAIRLNGASIQYKADHAGRKSSE